MQCSERELATASLTSIDMCKNLPMYVVLLLVCELEAWADGTNTSTVAQQVDGWLRNLADGSAEQQQEAITSLYSEDLSFHRGEHWSATTKQIWDAVWEYPFDITKHEKDRKSVRQNQERCEIMLRAIPHLIDELKTKT